MKYYTSWQAALMDYIEAYGDQYEDSYIMLADFEAHLNQNANGAYFVYTGDLK